MSQAVESVPLAFYVFTAFVMGACVGSFLNVVIARVPSGKSIVWPPSHCFSCGKAIEPFHNVPILSWFQLRGRCRNCLAPFSFRYAFIELAFGLICAFAVARHGLGWEAAREIALLGFLVPLAAIDLDTWLLPHALTWSGTLVGLALALPYGVDFAAWRLLAAAVGFTSLKVLAYLGELIFGKEALGGGDLWLFALIGAFLGIEALLPVIFLASVQGSIIGVLMILARKRHGQHEEDEAPVGDPAANPASSGDAASAEAPAEADAPVVAVPPAAGEAPQQAPNEPPTGEQEAATPSDPPRPGLLTVDAKAPVEDDWQPDPNAIPFGPFLALAAAEVHYFSRLTSIFFPY